MKKQNKTAYPRFTHDRIETHDIMGKMKVYEFTRYPSVNDSGCQTNFFRNNAEVNNSKQFGLKMFNTSVEAFAAYQRQKIAADAGLAPPVGMMIRWIIHRGGLYRDRKINRWGYETALADCSPHARHVAQILSSPAITDSFLAYLKENGITDRNDPFTKKNVRGFFNLWENEHDGFCSDFDSIPANAIGDLVDVDPYSPLEFISENNIRTRLMNLDINGTQYDDISDYDGDNRPWGDYLRLGMCYNEDHNARMGNDLHRGNMGLWKNSPVVVDFGYHIASPYFRFYMDCV